MRLLSKKLLSAVLTLGALPLFPEAMHGQAAQPLVRLDNSGCPAAATAAFSTAVPDSLSARVGSRLDESADIILLASVQADQIRFASKPDIRLRLCWGGDSLRVIERTNLPSPVVAGTTYRNVFINLEILGHANASCILARTAGVSCAGLNLGIKR